MHATRAMALGAAVALMLSAASARANDATAELGVGGLQMVYNSAIEVISEDLYVSPDEVRVLYHFRNITKEPVTATVAFPLPALDGTFYEDLWLDLADPNAENYVDFTVTVNGEPLTPSVYSRATALGVDRTDVLRAAGLPLNPAAYMADELNNLSPATLTELHRLGLLVVEPWGIQPSWRLETSFYWEMTFPPGEDVVVEHSYRPVVGYGFFGDYQLDDATYLDRYCMDDDFIAGARRMMGADPDFAELDERRIEYLLTPAANWASPIGTFHLTVDKGDTNAIVSFCGTGVTKTSPTTFELTETDFYPTRELDILIVDPIQY
jgi:hypothetical protein